jgi:hypothetical protein
MRVLKTITNFEIAFNRSQLFNLKKKCHDKVYTKNYSKN